MIHLAATQLRSVAHQPRSVLVLLAFLPALWVWQSGWLPVDSATQHVARWLFPLLAIQMAIAARGAPARAGSALGDVPFPTLPVTPRVRAAATFVTSLCFMVPGLFMMLGLETLLQHRPRPLAEALIQLARIVLVLVPLVGLGAVVTTPRAVAWAQAVGAFGLFVVGYTLGWLDTLPGALAWCVVGTALVASFGPRLGSLPGPGFADRLRSAAARRFAAAREPGAVTRSNLLGSPGTSPARAWWVLQGRQRLWLGLFAVAPLVGPIYVLTLLAGRVQPPPDVVPRLGGFIVLLLTMVTPIAPFGLGGRGIGAWIATNVLLRLPIAPRTLFLHALLAVVPLVLLGAVPLVLLLVTLGIVAPALLAPVSPLDAARMVGPAALSAVAGGLCARAGWHLGALVESPIRRAAPLLVAVLVVPAHAWLTLPKLPLPGGPEAWEGAGLLLALAVTCCVWAGSAVGRARHPTADGSRAW